jgi:hypothetical protein
MIIHTLQAGMVQHCGGLAGIQPMYQWSVYRFLFSHCFFMTDFFGIIIRNRIENLMYR